MMLPTRPEALPTASPSASVMPSTPISAQADLVMQTCNQTECHARRMGWLSEKDMDIRTEDFLKPEGHATRRAADTTRNVDEDRMCRVRMDASPFKLTD